MKKILAISTAAGIVSAAAMLLLTVLAKIGIYKEAANMMEQWHAFYSQSISGTITGMIEAFMISFIFVYGVVALYNKLSDP